MGSVTDPSVIAMFERQMAEFYTAARSRPWADVKVDDDVVWGTTGLPLSALNGAAAATFTEATADARIDHILDYFQELKIDISWLVGPTSTPADLGDRLAARGLVADGVEPGMAAPLQGWSPPVAPDGLVFGPALDAATFEQAIEVMFAGFEMATEVLLRSRSASGTSPWGRGRSSGCSSARSRAGRSRRRSGWSSTRSSGSTTWRRCRMRGGEGSGPR
jgi:hypothetical protein